MMLDFWHHIIADFLGNLPSMLFACAALIAAIANLRQGRKTHDLVNSGQTARDESMKAVGQLMEQSAVREREK